MIIISIINYLVLITLNELSNFSNNFIGWRIFGVALKVHSSKYNYHNIVILIRINIDVSLINKLFTSIVIATFIY